jgi:hypothetical protein
VAALLRQAFPGAAASEIRNSRARVYITARKRAHGSFTLEYPQHS